MEPRTATSTSSKSSTETSDRPRETFVLVGTIARAHGIRGEVLVDADSDVPGRFDPGSTLHLIGAGKQRQVQIESARRHGRRLLLRFAGIADRESAELLRGARLEVATTETPPAAPDTYYYFELAGCRCRDRRRGDLGQVTEVREDGGGVLLEVSDGERTLLVPFVRRFLVTVDRDRRLIEVDLPEGLIETCASPS